MKRMSLLAAVLALPLQTAAAQQKAAPTAGNDCFGKDYDCQPTTAKDQNYDRTPTVLMERKLPVVVELESLDKPGTRIRRYIFNGRGIMARDIPIEDSKDMFCTLSHATNVSLVYFPISGLWNFQVAYGPQADLMTGGLATCLDLKQLAGGAPP